MPSESQMSFTFDRSSTLSQESIARFGERLNRGIRTVMERDADKTQDYARNNAPWTDRTSNARNGLFARYEGDTSGSFIGNEVTTHRIILSHSVPYGIWLEVRWAGRYAIIIPTIQYMGPRVMDDLRGLISRLEDS